MIDSVSASATPATIAESATKTTIADCVLLVEDNADDVFVFQRLLRGASPATTLEVVTDGESALRWLAERVNAFAAGLQGAPRAIFLDLHLPGVPGAEVLRWIRGKPAFDRTLLVVCSSSSELEDIAASRRDGADLFFTKYPASPELAAMLRLGDPRKLRDSVKVTPSP
jgi:CheY-like chemotaxis protein